MTGFGRDPIPGLGIPSILDTLTPETTVLCLQNGPKAGRQFPLSKMRNHVGRSDPPAIVADVDLSDCELGAIPMVSRRHAELQWIGGLLQVVDLLSTNGTSVNGERLQCRNGRPSVPIALQAGDILKFANLEFEIRHIE